MVCVVVDDFKLVVLVSFEGVVFIGFGFIGGWIVIVLILGIL